MAVVWQPVWPWTWATVAACGLAVMGMAMGWAKDRWRNLGRLKWVRRIVFGLSLTCAVLVSVAAMNPVWVTVPKLQSSHLVVVLDASASVRTARGGWPGIVTHTSQRIASAIQRMDPALIRNTMAGIVLFRGKSVAVAKQIPLKELPNRLRRISEDKFPSDPGSHIASGLRMAATMLTASGIQGPLILVSDGHQTRGDALEVAGQLSKKGIGIHVFPVNSQGTDMVLMSADLPKQVTSEVWTALRGSILNHRPSAGQGTIRVARNPLYEDPMGRFGKSVSAQVDFRIPGKGWRRIRQPIQFRHYGIQFVDLGLADANGQWIQQRRFFTYVRKLPHILAIGDVGWARALGDNKARITVMRPEQLTPDTRFQDFDVVVISDVSATHFLPATLERLAHTVNTTSTGLMLINGHHPSGAEESPTMLMTYGQTALDPLLPVSTKPRDFKGEPGPRQVVILVDASGSMAGWGLEKARQIVRHIVEHLLRPKDHLDLIAFTTQSLHLMVNRVMDSEGKHEAILAINSLRAGGGTDPSEALALVADRQMENCGLIFISDGQFNRVAHRPDCRATVFAIGPSVVSPGSPLRKIADPFPVDPSFDPARITIPYFDPKPRKKYFEPGTFIPSSMKYLLARKDQLPVPSLPLQGAAVTVMRPQGRMIAVRPKLTDPVLAFGETSGGSVGVFTSGFPESWFGDENGRNAVASWIFRLIPFAARDRYAFDISDNGLSLDLRVSLIAQNFTLPRIHRLTVGLEINGVVETDVNCQPTDQAPGTFQAHLRVRRDHRTRLGNLVIRETGPDALARPQRIPILIPPAITTNQPLRDESLSYGTNEELLKAIADAGGGRYDPADSVPLLAASPPKTHQTPLWPFLTISAMIAYLLAITLQRWNP